MQVCNAFTVSLETKPSKEDPGLVWKLVTEAAVLSRKLCVSNSGQHAKQTEKKVSDWEWVRFPAIPDTPQSLIACGIHPRFAEGFLVTAPMVFCNHLNYKK
jgi:hypothetical protein